MRMITFAHEFVVRALPVRNRKDCMQNLRSNWYFPITAFSFLLLEARMSASYIIGFLLAVAVSVVIATQVKSVNSLWIREMRIWKIFHILTAAGICWAGQTFFYAKWDSSSRLQSLKNHLPGALDIGMIVSIALACAGLYFVVLALTAFWRWLRELFRGTSAFQLTRAELAVYAVLFLVLVAFITFAFMRSYAFYGENFSNEENSSVKFGVLFTCDPFNLTRKMCYLAITSSPNDFAQSLFAVFAAPFVGITYFIAKILFLPLPFFALLVNLPQIVLLFATVLLLAKTMHLSPGKHICFLCAAFFCFPFLLFSCVMEQYIIATFWLVLVIYLYVEKGKANRLAFCAAAGTLITGLPLAPLTSGVSPLREPRRWWYDILKTAAFFLAMLILIRFDVIWDLLSSPKSVLAFTSVKSTEALSFFDKFAQYSTFLCSCFVAPNAGAQIGHDGENAILMWLQNPVTKISVAGLVLFSLAILSAVLNHKQKIYRISAIWLGFSFFVLCIMGYGAEENGLLLYSLYFGWPLPVLLFGLLERIGNALRARWFTPACTALGAAALAWYNIPAMLRLLQFAVQYYPA